MNKVKRKWSGKVVKEWKVFKYLEYRLMGNGSQEAQIREGVKKAAIVIISIWEIGMRLFGKDCERRVWLFGRLVWTVQSYEAEIWRWNERSLVDRIQERFLRWTLGVDWRNTRIRD
ncbi:hypothetical protein QLX08_003831 [Tetragonisca angustula]|uniref:Uncharacterized protein n=1 Tax=Tetragonisca angustula TaxID=166442 RepID=A0AAW1A525_9HYME